MTRRRVTFVLLLLAGLVLASCTAEQPLNGLTRSTPLTVGDAVMRDVTDPAARGRGLIESDGLRFRAAEGRFLAVYFGFLQCPDICPTTLMDLRVALEHVDVAVAERVDVVFVTVDPERDTAQALGEYLTYFFPRFHVLRDDDVVLQRTLDTFLASAGVKRDAAGDVIEVTHTAVLYLVDAHGDVVVEWPFGTRSQLLADDLTQLARTVLMQ